MNYYVGEVDGKPEFLSTSPNELLIWVSARTGRKGFVVFTDAYGEEIRRTPIPVEILKRRI